MGKCGMNLRRSTVAWLASLMAGAVWWPSLPAAAERVIVYGDADYPPYSYMDNGQFAGMYVDILKQAAALMKPAYDVELVPVPWNRGLKYLETGEGLALFPPGLKKERTYIQSYSVPLYRETVVVFCNDKVMKTPRKNFPDDFAGLTMGINAGFLLSDRLMQAVHKKIVKIESGPNNESNLRKLAAQRIDCYVSDRVAALFSSKQLRRSDPRFNLALTEAAVLTGEDTFIGYSGVANPPYKSDFIRQMDAALTTLKNKGEVLRIIREYTH